MIFYRSRYVCLCALLFHRLCVSFAVRKTVHIRHTAFLDNVGMLDW